MKVIIKLLKMVTQVRTLGINIIHRKNTVIADKPTIITSTKVPTKPVKVPLQTKPVKKHVQVQINAQTTT